MGQSSKGGARRFNESELRGSKLGAIVFVARSIISTQLLVGWGGVEQLKKLFSTVSLAPLKRLMYQRLMSAHAYSRIWLHLTWSTLERRPLLSKTTATKLSAYLMEYAHERGIYMKLNYVNADHVHALIDLPTQAPLADVVQLFKGSSSHWVNENKMVAGKFAWGRGYGVFSVSESIVSAVARYIANQEEHHRRHSFMDEFKRLVERHKLKWCPENR